jgi:hypothetical protein
MTKDEWIWVAIRIFGIYLLVLSVIAIPEAIGNIYAYLKMSSAIQESAEFGKLATSLKEAAVAKGSTAVAQLILFSIISYYFLRHGKFIHKLASSERS